MPSTVLSSGTRKGCFLLESENRRDWELRGPSARAGPSTTPCATARPGAIYAAAASEWHGSAIWRSDDLGETWAHSSEGLALRRRAEELSKVSSLAAAHGRVLAGAEAAGIFESRDGGETWSLLSDPRGPARPRGLGRPGEPASRASRHVGADAGRRRPGRLLRRSCRASASSRPTDDGAIVDAAQPRPPRRLAAREHEEIGFCVHRLVRSPVDRDRMYQQNHVRHAPQRRRRAVVDGDHRGAAERVRLRRRGAPARPRHVLRHPARPAATRGRCPTARRPSGARATPARAGSSSTSGLPQQRRAPRRAAGGDDDRRPRRAGPLLRHEHGAAVRERRRGRRAGARSRATCPPIWSVEVAIVE